MSMGSIPSQDRSKVIRQPFTGGSGRASGEIRMRPSSAVSCSTCPRETVMTGSTGAPFGHERQVAA